MSNRSRDNKTDHNDGAHPTPRKDETMFFVPMDSAVKGKWTDEEMRYVLAQHKVMYCVDMATALGRTFEAVKNKAFRMGCSIKIKPQVSDTNE